MALKLMEMPGVIEVELANSSLKRGKSPRVDNIPMEFLKCGSEGAHCSVSENMEYQANAGHTHSPKGED